VTTTVPATGDGPYAFAIGAGATYGDVLTYRFTAVDKALGRNRSTLPAAPSTKRASPRKTTTGNCGDAHCTGR